MMHQATNTDYQLFVGIDVAATAATAAWMPVTGRPTRAITLNQTPAGMADLQRRLRATGYAPATILVVMEATGTYWMVRATTLAQAGFAVAVINPAQAHAFAKALLKRSKTDAIDAQTLAELAARLQPARWTPPPAVFTDLQQRRVHREALLDARTQFRNQRHALIQQPVVVTRVRERLDELIATLTTEIAAVELELADVLQQDEAWAAAAQRLQSIKGIGLLTAAWLLTTTINFTLCATPEAAANYAGLAPQRRQSGTSVRGRPVIGHGGNARLRRASYLAVLSGVRYNPILKAFYQRLIAKGKPPQVALCAAARKLVRIGWAVVIKEQDFDPAYAE